MNEQLVREIAEQIAQEQFWQQWPLYLLIIAIALVIGFAAAFVGGYARKRGDSYATKADFDDLLEQMEATTNLTEQIRVEVSHADWAARELKVLHRIKLEELLQAIHELQEWQSQEMSRLVYDSGRDSTPSPAATIERISGLYFPDLKEDIDPFLQLHQETVIVMLNTAHQLASFQPQHLDSIKKVRAQFGKKFQPIYEKQLQAVATIQGRARAYMEAVINA